MTNIKVSVICPIYNKERYVAECIQSCTSQTLRDIEIIAVDDGSQDGSLGIVKSMAEEDSRVKIFAKKNEGAAIARNYALSRATGRFVFFIDGDDYIPSEDALEKLYEAAVINNVNIAGGSMCIDRDGAVDFDSLHGKALDSFGAEQVLDYSDYQYDYDFTRYIYSREMLLGNGIEFPPLRQFEDPPFFVHAMLTAGRFATIPDAVYAYRYGFQPGRKWSADEVIDRADGIYDLLTIASNHSLSTLQYHLCGQLSEEMTRVILDHANDPRVMHSVYRAQGAIDATLICAAYPDFPKSYVIEALMIMTDEYTRFEYLRNTSSGRAFRRMLAIKRKIIGK